MAAKSEERTASLRPLTKNRFVSWLLSPASDVVLFVAVLVLANLVASRAFLRFDLTAPRSYSLSASSKEVVRTVDKPLSIKVFFSSNLPAPYSTVNQYVKDILAEYNNAANRNFNYEYYDMAKPDNEAMARSYGLQQVQVREVKSNEVGFKNAYMGMVITYADQIEKLDGLTSAEGLEYKITSTISKAIAASNSLSSLSEKVQLTLYKTQKLSEFGIGNFSQIDSTVRSACDELSKKYGDVLEFHTQSPLGQHARDVGERYGLQVVNWSEDNGVSYGVLGLVLEYGETFRVVPLQLQNMIFQYVVAGLENLPENLDQSLKSLVSKTSIVGYVTGHGELSLTDAEMGAANFASLLNDDYTLTDLNLSADNIPVGMQSVIVNGPRQAFTEAELYKLDQFVLKGGNLLVFLDPYDVIMPQGQNARYQMPQYEPIHTGLETLLSAYGITEQTAYVLDENCYSQIDQQYGKMNFYYAPWLHKDNLAKKHPITSNLGYVLFLQSGPLDVSEAQKKDGERVTVLASSSPRSWLLSDNIMLSPLYLTAPADKTTEKAQNLAVLLEGTFTSAYDAPPQNQTENVPEGLSASSHVSASTLPGRLLVAGTSAITTGQVLGEESTAPIAMFLRNAVDYLNGNEDLCTMRTKGLSLNTLKETSAAAANTAKYFNEVGLALLVVLAGVLVYAARRAHRTAIRMRYNPEDSRELSGKKHEVQK
ncbi:MAG: Gldg family protein [Treponema sp.]|nr:Gldg family protein [Treponema sp.]